MNWNIITDSSCDLFGLEKTYENISFSSVPFIISCGDKEYVDDENINISEMLDAMEASTSASRTACPSPQSWYEEFKKPGNCVAITISSNLSGSYNSACSARKMILEDYPDKKIAIIDSFATGPESVLIIRWLCKMIESGVEFENIEKMAALVALNTKIVFALSSFNNLVKNGRMSKIAGFIAGKFGFWGIGIGSDVGTIVIKSKCRGSKKALQAIIDDLKERKDNITEVVISHCHNNEFAENLKNAIEEIWEAASVTIIPARGLDSFYAERGGLIISY